LLPSTWQTSNSWGKANISEWRPTGYLEVGLAADGDGPVDAYRDFLDAIGRGDDIEPVPAAKIERELGSALLGKALFDRRGGQFNPLTHGSGLARRGLVHG